MKDPLPDKTILLIILSTIILVFSFIFTFKKPAQYQIDQSIQWKESSTNNVQVLKT